MTPRALSDPPKKIALGDTRDTGDTQGLGRPVYTAHQGTNADLIAQVARLYLRPGLAVADVTYGKGVFWQQVDLTAYDFRPSDLADGIDFRALPYADESIDALILDPPYMPDPGRPMVNDRYRNRETTRGLNHAGIVQLYADGLAEAYRVLKPGGMAWVKCADYVHNNRQNRLTIEVRDAALALGFGDHDKFTLVTMGRHVQHAQKHARKNDSTPVDLSERE